MSTKDREIKKVLKKLRKEKRSNSSKSIIFTFLTLV